MPPKKTGKARAKTASKKKAKANTVGAKKPVKVKTKKNPGKIPAGPKKEKNPKPAAKGNKPAPPKKETNPNPGIKTPKKKPKADAGKKPAHPKKDMNPSPGITSPNMKPKAEAGKKPITKKQNTDPVKGSVKSKKRKNPNLAQGQNPAKRKRTSLASEDMSMFSNYRQPAPVQPIVHAPVSMGNITVQTSGKSDYYQPLAILVNRFNNDEVINQRVTNDAAVSAQSHKIDNSQTGNKNDTDENQLFLRKYCAELIDKIKNVTEIVDHLKLGNEQAAIVRARRTEQEKMRTLLGFTTSKSAAKDLVLGLWRCARDVMEDLTDSN
ncbi:neurofilament heavy polypeptide-like isoform X1 [Hemibagrus wyckioides]|uniref:neurofilament heavy polypeptide-like isoform X1 n=1 Tax=Hemibagrus wyckioides TaxID=337641 RepID=UPI00266BA6FB|nr:neurofilament heavy polypeptide-like isoform X1 [Hemibagrus wyckioides]